MGRGAAAPGPRGGELGREAVSRGSHPPSGTAALERLCPSQPGICPCCWRGLWPPAKPSSGSGSLFLFISWVRLGLRGRQERESREQWAGRPGRARVRMKSGRVFTRHRQHGGRLESRPPRVPAAQLGNGVSASGNLSTDTAELRPPESG